MLHDRRDPAFEEHGCSRTGGLRAYRHEVDRMPPTLHVEHQDGVLGRVDLAAGVPAHDECRVIQGLAEGRHASKGAEAHGIRRVQLPVGAGTTP
jgi:hypothetical protein